MGCLRCQNVDGVVFIYLVNAPSHIVSDKVEEIPIFVVALEVYLVGRFVFHISFHNFMMLILAPWRVRMCVIGS